MWAQDSIERKNVLRTNGIRNKPFVLPSLPSQHPSSDGLLGGDRGVGGVGDPTVGGPGGQAELQPAVVPVAGAVAADGADHVVRFDVAVRIVSENGISTMDGWTHKEVSRASSTL